MNFSSPKGYALIINNNDFWSKDENGRTVKHPRKGTDADERSIRRLLEQLGYNVTPTRENLTGNVTEIKHHYWLQ